MVLSGKNATELAWHKLKKQVVLEMPVRHDGAIYMPIF